MRSFLLLIDGPPGAGKTSVAEVIHQKFPRTALLGHDRIVSLISGFKRDERNNAVVRAVGPATARAFLEHGMNVIVEQPFNLELARKYQRLGKRLNVKTVTIQLAASRELSLRRIEKRNKGARTWKTPHVVQARLLRNLRRHENRPPISTYVIDTSNRTARQIAAEIAQHIRSRRPSK